MWLMCFHGPLIQLTSVSELIQFCCSLLHLLYFQQMWLGCTEKNSVGKTITTVAVLLLVEWYWLQIPTNTKTAFTYFFVTACLAATYMYNVCANESRI